jgi:hypothetical protein
VTTLASPMRFSVDPWDPSYGASLEIGELGESSARVAPEVELPRERWRPLDAEPGIGSPAAVLFVDGVRRIDAQVWVDEAGAGTGASPALCASYAAGVVRCDAGGAHLAAVQVRRGLFTTAAHALDVVTAAGTYRVSLVDARPDIAPAQALGLALQARLAEAEVAAAVGARTGRNGAGRDGSGQDGSGQDGSDEDLLVVDGPLRGRQHLPRALGYVKSHRSTYLPPELGGTVAALGAGQRTPVFALGSSWDRYSWYLRLPCPPGAPWAGVVRLECGAALRPAEAVTMARLSQVTLCRYASEGYKDARAPQNLYPIAGLERALRRRLGEAAVLYRGLRAAAAG